MAGRGISVRSACARDEARDQQCQGAVEPSPVGEPGAREAVGHRQTGAERHVAQAGGFRRIPFLTARRKRHLRTGPQRGRLVDDLLVGIGAGGLEGAGEQAACDRIDLRTQEIVVAARLRPGQRPGVGFPPPQIRTRSRSPSSKRRAWSSPYPVSAGQRRVMSSRDCAPPARWFAAVMKFAGKLNACPAMERLTGFVSVVQRGAGAGVSVVAMSLSVAIARLARARAAVSMARGQRGTGTASGMTKGERFPATGSSGLVPILCACPVAGRANRPFMAPMSLVFASFLAFGRAWLLLNVL